MKRYLVILLALVLLLTSLAAVASAGIMVVSGEEGGLYLADAPTGKIIEFAGWREDIYEGSPSQPYWFYSEGKGKLAEGWKQIGGQWYYFWPEMCTSSWYDQPKDTVYLFGENGAWTGVSTSGDGWLKMNNQWYYVKKYTKRFEERSTIWKYFYSNGNYEINGKNYLFKNGVMKDDGWNSSQYTWDGKTYTDWYYANPNGELATGWKQIDGKWYYFNGWGGMYNDGIWWIDDKPYAFEKSGAMKANQWHGETYTWEGTTYTDWFYMGADGAAKTGWFKVGNDWYYANDSGWMWSDCWLEDGDNMYYLKKSGAMAENEWIQDSGIWYYFKGSGAMAENEWVQDGGAWYWLKNGGDMAANETVTISGKEYKFAASGAWIP